MADFDEVGTCGASPQASPEALSPKGAVALSALRRHTLTPILGGRLAQSSSALLTATRQEVVWEGVEEPLLPGKNPPLGVNDSAENGRPGPNQWPAAWLGHFF